MKIGFAKSYEMISYGLKVWEKRWLEDDLEIKTLDDIDQVWDEFRAKCDSNNKKNNPSLIVLDSEEKRYINGKQSPKEEAEVGVIQAINSCTELKVLETFQKLAKSKPEFQEAYDNQLKKLTNA